MGRGVTPRIQGTRPDSGEERLRVVLISFEFSEVLVALANGLATYADVCLMLPEDELRELAVDLAPPVLPRPFPRARLRQPLRQWQLCSEIVGEVDRFRPDVVHVQQGHLWLNVFALPRLAERYPLVLTIHDPSPHLGDRPSARNPQAVVNFGYRQARQVIVHTQAVGGRVVRELRRSPDEVHVVPHVSVPPGAAEDEPGAHQAAEHPTILFFGRIWPYKGLDYLIRAEPHISAAVSDVEIVIAGGGEPLGRYRRFMLHPERFIIKEGFIPRSERARLFTEAWLVVVPYVDATQSGVIPMASAWGKPVVATRVGGLTEMVDDGVTGLLVPPRDERALADAIVSLLLDAGQRQRLGDAGRRKAQAEWAPDAVARETVAVYQRTIARAPRRA